MNQTTIVIVINTERVKICRRFVLSLNAPMLFFFSFPKDENTRKLWEIAIRREDPKTKGNPWKLTATSRICKDQ